MMPMSTARPMLYVEDHSSSVKRKADSPEDRLARLLRPKGAIIAPNRTSEPSGKLSSGKGETCLVDATVNGMRVDGLRRVSRQDALARGPRARQRPLGVVGVHHACTPRARAAV